MIKAYNNSIQSLRSFKVSMYLRSITSKTTYFLQLICILDDNYGFTILYLNLLIPII